MVRVNFDHKSDQPSFRTPKINISLYSQECATIYIMCSLGLKRFLPILSV